MIYGTIYSDFSRDYRIVNNEVWDSTSVFCTTCSHSGSETYTSEHFDFIIVDEAQHCSFMETLIPLVNFSATKFLLVGDEKQLKPQLYTQKNHKSLFEILMNLDIPKLLLTTQLRMPKHLCDFISEEFYGGKLKNGKQVISTKNTIIFKNIKSIEEKNVHSYRNLEEVKAIIDLLTSLMNMNHDSADIGIISFYEAQTQFIIHHLRETSWLRSWLEKVEIKNVDGFQGREKKVIILSTVRSNHLREIGMLFS